MPTASPSSLPAPHREPVRVLVAEDDEAMRQLLRDVLKAEGYEVSVASDGLDLLDRVSGDAHGTFDLVVSDIRMPVLTGVEVLALTSRAERPTFVFVTAFVDPELMARAVALGAGAVLSKPFELSELLLVVRTLLAGRCADAAEAS